MCFTFIIHGKVKVHPLKLILVSYSILYYLLCFSQLRIYEWVKERYVLMTLVIFLFIQQFGLKDYGYRILYLH